MNGITVQPTANTTYTLTYLLNGCSAVSNNITISVLPIPTVSINSTTICNGETATLTASVNPTGGTYLWSTNSQTTSSITVNPTNTSTFSLLYSLAGCQQSAQSTVTVNLIPTATVNNTTICVGESGTLTATTNPSGGTYLWTPSGQTASSLTVSPITNTTYQLQYTLNGCAAPIASGTVTVTPLPTLAINSPSICDGDNAVITVIPSIPGGTFLWLPDGQTSSSIAVSPSNTTTYSVLYTVANCPAVTEVATVTVNSVGNVSFLADKLTGCAPLNVEFTNTSEYLGNCSWQINNSIIPTCELSYTFTTPGCYNVSLTINGNGCSSTYGVADFICVEATPNASFTSSFSTFNTSPQSLSFTNFSTGASSYYWNFGNGNSSTLTNPEILFTNTQNGANVWLYAFSSSGCIDSAYLYIPFDEGEIFYIPNTFTPDGDMYNQTFKPVFTSGFDPYNYELIIFNRWGEIVFVSLDPSIGWDGSYGDKGLDVADGTFTYKVTYKNPKKDERKIVKGHVNMIR
jgi:gliding motility-associated-like protein